MKKYIYSSLFLILFIEGCKKVHYVKPRPEDFTGINSNLVFFPLDQNFDPNLISVYNQYQFDNPFNLKDAFPNIPVNRETFGLFAIDKKIGLIDPNGISIIRSDYMEFVERLDFGLKVRLANYIGGFNVMLLTEDSFYQIYDFKMKTLLPNKLKLNAADKVITQGASVYMLNGNKVKTYLAPDFRVIDSATLPFKPGAFCTGPGGFFFIKSVDYAFQYPEIHVYSGNLQFLRKFTVPKNCIAVNNLFIITNNANVMFFVFNGLLIGFNISDGTLTGSGATQVENMLDGCTEIGISREFTSLNPIIKFKKINEWYFLIQSTYGTKFKYQRISDGDRRKLCIGAI
ncbi:MAG: hypothetical protein KG003_02340 [Bacteroidetes bacterium]|nr:hypothetical protein [Bacteroidota bacterium]